MIGALVPAKALDQAKTRLASLLYESERQQLALAMLEDVVRALQSVSRIDAIAVVSPDSAVLELADALGVSGVAEPESARGINAALSYARNVMCLDPADDLIVVLADVPALTSRDIDAVLDGVPSDRGAAICRSQGGGTSALALRPLDALPFRFGERSFDAHMSEANARGLPIAALEIDSLARDVDEPDDLLRLLEDPADTATHRFLTEIRLSERLPIIR